MDEFWAAIDQQIAEIREAGQTADQVIAILNRYGPPSSGDAFFAGSGGDTQLCYVLAARGWTWLWSEADYHWAMQAPDGSKLTYVEGDVYRGDEAAQRPAADV